MHVLFGWVNSENRSDENNVGCLILRVEIGWIRQVLHKLDLTYFIFL